MAIEVDFTSLDITDTSACQAPRQGTRWWWRIHISNFDAHGLVARMMWRVRTADAEPILSLTEDDGQLVWDDRGSDSTEAILRIDVSAVAMAEIAARLYRYDLEFVPGGDEDEAYAFSFGKIALQAEVTK